MENFIYDRLNWTLLLRIIYYFGKPVQGTNNYCVVVLVVELEHVTSASNTEGPKSFSRVGCGEHVSCNGIFFFAISSEAMQNITLLQRNILSKKSRVLLTEEFA